MKKAVIRETGDTMIDQIPRSKAALGIINDLLILLGHISFSVINRMMFEHEAFEDSVLGSKLNTK